MSSGGKNCQRESNGGRGTVYCIKASIIIWNNSTIKGSQPRYFSFPLLLPPILYLLSLSLTLLPPKYLYIWPNRKIRGLSGGKFVVSECLLAGPKFYFSLRGAAWNGLQQVTNRRAGKLYRPCATLRNMFKYHQGRNLWSRNGKGMDRSLPVTNFLSRRCPLLCDLCKNRHFFNNSEI